MKQLFAVFFFILSNLSSYSQIDGDALNILENIIRIEQPEGKIIYTDKINNTDVFKIKLKLKNASITGKSIDTKQNFIILTRQERKDILDQFDILSNPYWTENLFQNSQLIKEDNVWAYFKNAYQEYSESYANPNNSMTDKSNLLKNYQQPLVLEFSNPIFIREKSFCLVYFRSLCGNPCGYSELAFYKKENNKWNKWVVVSFETY